MQSDDLNAPFVDTTSLDHTASESRKRASIAMATEAVAEYRRAQRIYGPYPSIKHGLETIREELEELAEEARKRKPNKSRMREEAIQICAAAMQFVTDVCDG